MKIQNLDDSFVITLYIKCVCLFVCFVVYLVLYGLFVLNIRANWICLEAGETGKNKLYIYD